MQRVDAAQAGADDQDVIIQVGVLVEVRRGLDAAHVAVTSLLCVGRLGRVR